MLIYSTEPPLRKADSMTLAIACAASDAIVVAAESLISVWSGKSVPDDKFYEEKIFPIGESVIAYAGQRDWAWVLIEEVKKRALLIPNATTDDLAYIIGSDLKSIFDKLKAEAIRKEELKVATYGPLAPNEIRAASLTVEFLCCGWVAAMSKRQPRCYYFTSKDGFRRNAPEQMKVIGLDQGQESTFISAVKDHSMNADKIRNLLTYCIWSAIYRIGRDRLDGPVRVWKAENGKQPVPYSIENKETESIYLSVKKSVESFREQI